MRSMTFPAQAEPTASLGDMAPTSVYLLLIEQEQLANYTDFVFCGIFSTADAAIARGKEITAMIPDYHEAKDASVVVYPFTLDEALPVKLEGVRTWSGLTPPLDCQFSPWGVQQNAIWHGRTRRRMIDGSERLTGVLK